MKILLLGYMGSGKSTISKYLGERLNMPFMDLDDYIEAKEQLSIKEIFHSKGEIYFRKKENQYLKDLLSKEDSFVLALGGGTPCYANNMEMILKQDGVVAIYLQLSIPVLVERLKNQKQQRPLIASLKDDQLVEYIAKHLFERRAYYEQANFTIKSDHKSVQEISNEITSLLN